MKFKFLSLNFLKFLQPVKMLALLLLIIFPACMEYQEFLEPNILPQHIKKICITKFKDNFDKNIFLDKLFFTIKDNFNQDNRIVLKEETEADAMLLGELTRYILQPLEYDSNKTVTRYMLWVWINISLYDNKTKRILWTEEKLEKKIEFNTNSRNTLEPTTETEAQDIIIDYLAEKVRIRTIDGWFRSSGVIDTVYL